MYYVACPEVRNFVIYEIVFFGVSIICVLYFIAFTPQKNKRIIMSEVTAPVTAPKSPKKSKTVKKVATHPKYSEMVQQSIAALKERGGSSRQAILKYMMKNFNLGNEEKTVNVHLKLALKTGVTKATLKQTKGTGASGSFKNGEIPKPKKVVKKKPAPKPKQAKKAKKPKTPAKKAAPKKKDVKKTSPKKKATKTKSTPKKVVKKPAATKTKKPAAKTAKKPAVKKPAAKKPTTKKAPTKK